MSAQGCSNPVIDPGITQAAKVRLLKYSIQVELTQPWMFPERIQVQIRAGHFRSAYGGQRPTRREETDFTHQGIRAAEMLRKPMDVGEITEDKVC